MYVSPGSCVSLFLLTSIFCDCGRFEPFVLLSLSLSDDLRLVLGSNSSTCGVDEDDAEEKSEPKSDSEDLKVTRRATGIWPHRTANLQSRVESLELIRIPTGGLDDSLARVLIDVVERISEMSMYRP